MEVIKNPVDGWYVSVANGIVESFFVCMKSGYQGYSTFGGRIVKNCSDIKLDNESTPVEVDLIFGVPVEFFEDEVSINRRYSLGDFFVEFDWGTQGEAPQLNYFSIDRVL